MYKALIVDLESTDDKTITSISWAKFCIKKKRVETRMRNVPSISDRKHFFVQENMSKLDDSSMYKFTKFRKECIVNRVHGIESKITSWESIAEELEMDLVENDYNFISHSVDNDVTKIVVTNDLYGKDKTRFIRDPMSFPHAYSDRPLWNNVNFICSQMIINYRAPAFKDELIKSYVANQAEFTYRYGSSVQVRKFRGAHDERISLALTDIVRHRLKKDTSQSHTAYKDVLDLYDVLVDVFNNDGIDAFPCENFYVRKPNATTGIR